jgi:hypothetical protein
MEGQAVTSKKPENKTKAGPPPPPAAHRFKKGQSGNPGGRAKTDPHLKEFLASKGVEYFRKAEEVLEKALKKGDMKAAATVINALLKKVAPDADVILVHRTEEPLEVKHEVKQEVTAQVTHQVELPNDSRLTGILSILHRAGAEAVIRREAAAVEGADAAPDDAVHTHSADDDAGGGTPSG